MSIKLAVLSQVSGSVRYRIVRTDAHDALYAVYRVPNNRCCNADRGNICSLQLSISVYDAESLFVKYSGYRNESKLYW